MPESAPAPGSVPVPVPAQFKSVRKVRATYDPEQLAQSLADNYLSGKQVGIRKAPQLGPVTEKDRDMLARVTGEPVEQFNRRLSGKLRLVADLALERIREALEQDRFKPSELGFVLSVTEDKRARLDGNSAIHSATVNVQVNNYNGSGTGQSREQLMDLLDGNRAETEQGLQLFRSPSKDPETVPSRPNPPKSAQADTVTDAQLPTD